VVPVLVSEVLPEEVAHEEISEPELESLLPESERVPEKEPGSPNDPEETKFSSSICPPLPVISGVIFHSTGSVYSVEFAEVSESSEAAGSVVPLPEATAPLPELAPLPEPFSETGEHISLLTV